MTSTLRLRMRPIVARLRPYFPEWRKMVIWLVVLCLAGSMVGCAAVQNGSPYVAQPGYIETVRFSAVLAGMRDAVMGNANSLIMFNQQNGQVLFAWPRAGGWAWAVLDSRLSALTAIRKIGGAGNLMSCGDFSCLIKGAETIGYRQVTAQDLIKLAPAFCESVMQQTVHFAATAMTTIFVVPAGSVPADPWATSQQ